jgi:hypothetical protein
LAPSLSIKLVKKIFHVTNDKTHEKMMFPRFRKLWRSFLQVESYVTLQKVLEHLNPPQSSFAGPESYSKDANALARGKKSEIVKRSDSQMKESSDTLSFPMLGTPLTELDSASNAGNDRINECHPAEKRIPTVVEQK